MDVRFIPGGLYCLFWYLSILSGYLTLFCPILPLIFISNKLYRHATDFILTFWQLYPTVLLELLFGCDVQVTGDVIQAGETSLLLMNHRTRTDWNYLWPAVYHGTWGKGRAFHPTKFVLKDIIKHIPGIGWAMQLSCFLYIKRNWTVDKIKVENMIGYYGSMKYKFSLLIFPEGTDLTPRTKIISDKYAEKNNLQKYDFVLHPRTTGFTFLAYKLLKKRELDAIYDVTLVYCDNVPQSETSMLKGQVPKTVRMHFAKYPASFLPHNEQGLRHFLEQRWLEKEKVLKEYERTGIFLHGRTIKRNRPKELYFAFLFWTSLPFITAYILWVSDLFRWVVLCHTLGLLLLNFIVGGFQNFEIFLYNFKKEKLNWAW